MLQRIGELENERDFVLSLDIHCYQSIKRIISGKNQIVFSFPKSLNDKAHLLVSVKELIETAC